MKTSKSLSNRAFKTSSIVPKFLIKSITLASGIVDVSGASAIDRMFHVSGSVGLSISVSISFTKFCDLKSREANKFVIKTSNLKVIRSLLDLKT